MTLILPRRSALRAPWRASLAVLAVVICCQTPVVVSKEQSLLKIQLHKQRSVSDLSHRLAHQEARTRRRAQEEADTVDGDFKLGAVALSESPLGVGYGTHYAEIYLGIPAQRASVIVDTGSHLTALPCSSCNGCGQHTDPLFEVSKSTTAKYLACHDFDSCRSCEQDRCYISQSYMEGSMWEAVMVDELVWVGGFSTPSDEMEGILKTFGFRFPVGCQTKETGLFITQKENGIMGLGRHRSTVMSYMLNAGRVAQNLFTLCFAGDGGELVFGGVDYSHHTSDVGYTPLLNDKSAYYPVHVKDIRMNGVSLGIDTGTINSGRGVIVDSGTTDTFFDAKGSRNFMKAFREAAGGREYSEKRMKLTKDELAGLPIISIILSGMNGDGTDDVQLDIPASKYLTLSDDGGSYYGNFHFSERSGGVLGASTMVGFDVIFDTENKRVGFAESDCGKSYINTSDAKPIASNTSTQSPTETVTPVASNTTPSLSKTVTPVASNNTPSPSQTVSPVASDTTQPTSETLAPVASGTNQSTSVPTAPSATDTAEQPVSTNTPSSNSSSMGTNNTATALADAAGSGDATTGSSSDVTVRRSSPKFGAFIAEVILISMVGVALAVMVWTKWRTRSWSRIPDATETSRAQMQIIVDDDTPPTSPTRRILSPRSRAARKGPSPKFTIGSSGEEDEFREEEEGIGSPTLGSTQAPLTYCSMLVGDDIEGRCKQRAFLDAAAHGDLAGVDAWLRTGGDVNVTMGEGWTALHYAVAHSRMDIVHRLLEGNNVDLNATTITGSSALTLAFARKSNTLVTLLLSNGASRSTISMELWQDLETATWIRAEVRRSLSSDYTVVWNPTLHRHFPPVEREKCRLVVQANVLALRQLVKPATKGTTSSSSSLTVVNWKEEIIQQFWWAVAALTESFREDELCVRWRYLAPPLVYHIIEYAVFLW